MSNLNVDTAKLYESGQDIIDLTKELNEEFDVLFNRISSMATRTFEWVGPSSQMFIRRTNLEKIEYVKLINTLNNYGKMLIDASDRYDSVIKK